MTDFGMILLFTVLMYGIQELFRRAPAHLSFVTFSVLPIFLAPYWLATHEGIGFFPWVKLFTVVISVSWLTALRGTDFGNHRVPAVALIGLLVLNIVEALSLDAAQGHLSHWLVMLAGTLMVVTLPSAVGAGVTTNGVSREFTYPEMTRRWILEYTIWNWTFVFLNFPIIAGQHVAVLGAALIVGMIDPRRWLQARGHSLAASLLLSFTFPDFIVRSFDTTSWHTPYRAAFASLLCLVVAIISSLRWAKERRTELPVRSSKDGAAFDNEMIGTGCS